MLMAAPSTWEHKIRVHRNIPRLWMFPIRSMYLEAINRAQRNVWMTHAYFIPDESFVDALVEPPGATSTYACCCRRSPTTSSPTGSRGATSARCSPPG